VPLKHTVIFQLCDVPAKLWTLSIVLLYLPHNRTHATYCTEDCDPQKHFSVGGEADELREDAQADTEPICLASNGEPSRGRPRMKPTFRANKSAQQNSSLVEGQVHGSDATNGFHLQQQQEGVPDESQDRFTRMLRDSGVTVEELAEDGY